MVLGDFMGNEKLLDNQTAIITGASGGLGETISNTLAKEGANVILVYNNNKKGADTLQEKIQAYGGHACVIKADVSCEDDVIRLVEYAIDRYSRIDILINNAGISINGISWKLDSKDWRRTIDVNLTGSFLCVKHVLPHMRRDNFGRIINISSIVGQMGVPGTSAYAASKSGLIGFTKAVAMEVANRNITVNTIALGYFETGMINSINSDQLDALKRKIPLKRLGKVEELSWVVRFLCSPLASYVTGEVINVSGGL